MPIQSLQEAISSQAEINRFLAKNGIKDLVGDYGELLIHKAFGGNRENVVNQGFDIQHPQYKRIEVKTRKYELLQGGGVRKEGRAVGFKGKENGFDWLAHIVALLINSATRQQFPCGFSWLSSVAAGQAFLVL